MAGPQSFAYRIRWALLVLGVLCSLFGIWLLVGAPPTDMDSFGTGVLASPFSLPIGLEDENLWMSGLVVLGGVLLMQYLFLAPGRGWLPRVSHTGRPMKMAIAAAAFMAMVVTAGLIFTVLEVVDRYQWLGEEYQYLGFWAIMFFVWVIWGFVFFLLYRNTKLDRFTWMTRMVNRLLAGSIVQVLMSSAVYAWNPRGEKQCHCARGSYTGLVFGGTVMLWTFGPGLILLFMREKYRRELIQNRKRCANCSYDLRGSLDRKKCPECGEPIVTD